jgi:hypothetical protein
MITHRDRVARSVIFLLENTSCHEVGDQPGQNWPQGGQFVEELRAGPRITGCRAVLARAADSL